MQKRPYLDLEKLKNLWDIVPNFIDGYACVAIPGANLVIDEDGNAVFRDSTRKYSNIINLGKESFLTAEEKALFVPDENETYRWFEFNIFKINKVDNSVKSTFKFENYLDLGFIDNPYERINEHLIVLKTGDLKKNKILFDLLQSEEVGERFDAYINYLDNQNNNFVTVYRHIETSDNIYIAEGTFDNKGSLLGDAIVYDGLGSCLYGSLEEAEAKLLSEKTYRKNK